MARLSVCVAWVLLCVVAAAATSRAQSGSPRSEAFDFGNVGLNDELQHTFEFTNVAGRALDIENVELTPPPVVTKMPSRIAPGEEANVTVRLKTPREKGDSVDRWW